MKLKEKVSWLMGRMQRQLFPCLEDSCTSPLTEQERKLVTIHELIKVEDHIGSNRKWMGRPPAERKAIGRCFIAKAFLRYPYTRNLIHELKARPNLRLICGFPRQSNIPSEATFSRAFAEFAGKNLATLVNHAMVHEYLGEELIGHICRDSTAIKGREKAVRKVKEVKIPRKRGRPPKGENRSPQIQNDLRFNFSKQQMKLLPNCRKSVIEERKRILKDTRRAGQVINSMLMSMMLVFP